MVPEINRSERLFRTELLDPTERLLVECVRTDDTDVDLRVRLIDACRAAEWHRLVDQAAFHGVIGYAQEALSSLEEHVPGEVLNTLRQVRIAQIARIAMANRDVAIITSELTRLGIENILFKGPVLDEVVYQRDNMRSFGDLDYFVRKEDIARAIDAFTALGYSLVEDKADIFTGKGKIKNQVHLAKEGSLPIDLHWKLINLPTHESSIAVDYDEIWRSAKMVEVGGTTIKTLSPEDTLIFQCVHMTAHHDSNRLIWFKDVEQVVRRYGPGMDWDNFARRVSRYHLKTFVYYALILTNEVCGLSEVPNATLANLKPKYLTARFFEQLARRNNILEMQQLKRKPVLELWRIMRDDSGKRYVAILRRALPKVDWYLEYYPVLPKIRHSELYYFIYPVLIALRLLKQPAKFD